MAVRALQVLILCLAVVAGIEVGYLARPAPPEPRVIVAAPAAPVAAPSVPACAPAGPPAAAVGAEPPSAPPRRRPRDRRETAGQIPDGRAVADCARNGGPLCGMPD
jgi:hypothetical protein